MTNTPNFVVPNSALGNTNFGSISNTGNNIPRQMQFAAKLIFQKRQHRQQAGCEML